MKSSVLIIYTGGTIGMEVDPITGSLTPLDFHHLEEHLPELGKFNLNIDSISFDDVIKKGLNVMDSTAFTLSQENKLPIIVFDMNKAGNLLRVVSGENIGTKVNL